MPSIRHELLEQLISQPTAPFRERHPAALITRTLEQGGVPFFRDPVGNIVIGPRDAREYARLVSKKPAGKAGTEPVRIFVAHMDHPGFHGESWVSGTELRVKWHGGSPTKFLEGAGVWVGSVEGLEGKGSVSRSELLPSGRAIANLQITLDAGVREKFPDATKLYGGFSFRAPCWREDELLYTQVADDLVGAFAIVSTALELWSKKPRKGTQIPFIGLITRAEEVGFIGAIGHFELGWLAQAKRELLAVSLETSRALPGAEIGKGPVVRLGDRFTVFEPGRLRAFTELAAKVLPEKHQRRIMDGGTCEATAATVYGLPAIGISVPLGNYHNQSFEGGPDSRGELGPAPEFVHLGDVAGLLELCKAIMRPGTSWSAPWREKRKEFQKSLKGYRTLLKGI